MIQFTNYKKQYGDTTVLDIPELQLADGIYWLKGINGSGKSTLLRSLAGLMPFEGTILIDGTDLNKNKQWHRRVVNFGEAEPVYPVFLTGMELINFYVETKKGSKETCLQLAQQLQLTDALNKKVGAYSSGMLKKLSLILAFAGQPKWVLLDEPLITLDVASIQVMLAYIESLLPACSFIITSHQDMDFPHHQLPIQTLLASNKTIAATL